MARHRENRLGSREAAFDISPGMELLGNLTHRFRHLAVRLGNVETRLLAGKLAKPPPDRPVFVTGLARSGTTILLEILTALPGTASHRYRDYPPIFTPFLWNWFLDHSPRKKMAPVERTHLDGIMVTLESPEAFEEVLWMTFFPDLHTPRVINVLDQGTSHPEFEKFYREHISKILHVRGGTRYVSKGNYNISRLEYLLKLFPDARFVIPVRRPDHHVASMMKQHRLFCEGETRNPRMLEHMRRVGHYEFGLDRRPINTGNDEAVREIADLWDRGEDIRGWGRYWALLYSWVADLLEANGALRDAALVVRYEDLCDDPAATLRRVLEHCSLAADDGALSAHAGKIRRPAYYRPDFSDRELSHIESEASITAARFGY